MQVKPLSKLTPRKVVRRIERIKASDDPQKAKRMRKRLLRSIVLGMAAGNIRSPRKCAILFRNGFMAS